jgi:hypothetical protein
MDSTMSSASGRLTPLSHSPWTGDSSNPSDRAICCRASKWSHAVPDEQRGVRPASALEYSPQVLVKARGRALADSRALSSFDQVDVVAEHAEPEGQVGVGNLVQGVPSGAPDRDGATHVPGPPQAFQRVVNPLLRPSGDPGPAAGAESYCREHSFVSPAPVKVLADYVHGVTDQDSSRLVGKLAKVRLDVSRLIPLIQVEWIPPAYGVGGQEVGSREVRQEHPRLSYRKRVQAQFKRRPAVQTISSTMPSRYKQFVLQGTCSTSNLYRDADRRSQCHLCVGSG